MSLVAEIDNALRGLISFRSINGIEMPLDLFAERGLLGSFTNKVQFCFVSGYFSSTGFKSLTALAKIRNRFAHDLDVVSFQHPRVRGQIDNLKILDTKATVEGQSVESTYENIFAMPVYVSGDPCERFKLAAHLFIIFCEYGATEEGKAFNPLL